MARRPTGEQLPYPDAATWKKRQDTERFRRYGYDELVKRDKLNLDLFWLKDAKATDPDTLPPPAEIAAEIVDSLETALEKFRLVAAKLTDARAT